jgi:protease PrsW
MEVRPHHVHLHHRSLFQPRLPAFWLYAALVVYGAIGIVDALSGLASISTSGWALTWLLLALYVIPVAVIVYRLDLHEREPISLVLGAFAWGAFAATALTLEAVGWDRVVAQLLGPEAATRWGPALTAPLVEETLKGVGIVLIYLIARDELDDVMDGFVYGAFVGLGFALVEDVVYFIAVFGGSPADVLRGFYVRVISSGLYGHVLYSGLVGMGVGYAVSHRHDRPLGTRLLVATGLAVAGVLGHALWNSPIVSSLYPAEPLEGIEWVLVPIVFAVKGLPLLGIVVIAVILARDRETRWLDRALVVETDGDGITPEELVSLRDPAARRRAVAAMRRRAGTAAANLLRRLHREQVNLAMVASRVATRDDPALAAQREHCRSLRIALHAIPGAAPAADR